MTNPDSFEHVDICAGAFSKADLGAFFLFEWKIHIQAQKRNMAWVGMFRRRRELLHNTLRYLHWGGTYSFNNTAGGGNWGASEEMLAVFQNKRVWRKEERRQGHVFHLNSEEIIKAHGEREPCLWSLFLIRYFNVRLMRHLEKQCWQQDFISGEHKPRQVAIRGRKESNTSKAENITFLDLERLYFKCPAR